MPLSSSPACSSSAPRFWSTPGSANSSPSACAAPPWASPPEWAGWEPFWVRPSPARWSPPASPTRGVSTFSPPPQSWRSLPSPSSHRPSGPCPAPAPASGTRRRQALLGEALRGPRLAAPPEFAPRAGCQHDGDADGGADDGLDDSVAEQEAGRHGRHEKRGGQGQRSDENLRQHVLARDEHL